MRTVWIDAAKSPDSEVKVDALFHTGQVLGQVLMPTVQRPRGLATPGTEATHSGAVRHDGHPIPFFLDRVNDKPA
ncbi:MAG TPA: hypothetical protein VHD90_17765 [Phototrophicaceae bacterium]|nr:hypothetical protein [Phototrophicaceae bacterium]